MKLIHTHRIQTIYFQIIYKLKKKKPYSTSMEKQEQQKDQKAKEQKESFFQLFQE